MTNQNTIDKTEDLMDIASNLKEEAYRISGHIQGLASGCYEIEIENFNAESAKAFFELAKDLRLGYIEGDLTKEEEEAMLKNWQETALEIETLLNDLGYKKEEPKKEISISEKDKTFLQGFDDASSFIKTMHKEHPKEFAFELIADHLKASRKMHLITFETIAKIKAEK